MGLYRVHVAAVDLSRCVLGYIGYGCAGRRAAVLCVISFVIRRLAVVVFKIFSKASGQHYIGACRGSVDKRWELYLRAAEAGLDFPLYKEIREHGEAQFTIEELDYADDIDELKEMELLHTVELAARSLRNYKFGMTDAVVKRIRQVDHERAWMKDLPEEPVRVKVSPVPKVQQAQPVVPRITSPKPKMASPQRSSPPVRASSPVNSVSEALPSIVSSTASVNDSAKPDHSTELDKALFVEGIGLLVRAVASVEQLSEAQQQVTGRAQSLSQALAESERALQQLQVQQDEAGLRARLAMEAVAASQSANRQLIELHRQAQERSASVMQVLEQSGDLSIQTAQLQQEFGRLMLRIKVGTSPSKSADVPPQPLATETDNIHPLAISVNDEIALQPSIDAPNNAKQWAEREEAKMVNQLKVLDQLIPERQGCELKPKVESLSTHRPLDVQSPARAWVATTADDPESALVLVKDAAPATVVLRRAKASSLVAGTAVLSRRKTLSIKAR